MATASDVHVYVLTLSDRSHYALRYRDPVTGKRKTVSSGVPVGRSNISAARAKAEELRKQLIDGDTTEADPSWDAFEQRYTDEVMPGLAKHTQAKVRSVFKRLRSVVQVTKLSQVREPQLGEFVKQLRAGGLSESTVHSYLAQLRAAMKWAEDQRMLRRLPKFPKIQRRERVTGETPMKGRPISLEEFERMLAAVPRVVGLRKAEPWRHLMQGLWLSGLRLTEAMSLSWDELAPVTVLVTTSRKGVQCRMQIDSGSQKRNRSEVVPLTPDFGEFLLQTPLDDRGGFVFNPSGTRTNGRPSAVWVGKVISKIGKLAGVLVADRDGKQKYASAHDLRRAFGKRWAYAEGMNPMKLKRLMRHASIETTMRYYVDSDDADDALDDVFAAYHRNKRQAAKADRQTAEHAS